MGSGGGRWPDGEDGVRLGTMDEPWPRALRPSRPTRVVFYLCDTCWWLLVGSVGSARVRGRPVETVLSMTHPGRRERPPMHCCSCSSWWLSPLPPRRRHRSREHLSFKLRPIPPPPFHPQSREKLETEKREEEEDLCCSPCSPFELQPWDMPLFARKSSDRLLVTADKWKA